MSKLGSMEDLLEGIEGYLKQKQAGDLGLQDLENLVEFSRELQERCLILRYKAYEKKVFGDTVTETEAIVEEPEISAETPTEVVPEQEAEEEPKTEQEPAFDFALFDNPDEEEPVFELDLGENESLLAESRQFEPEVEESDSHEEANEEEEQSEAELEEEKADEQLEKGHEPMAEQGNLSEEEALFEKIFLNDGSLANQLMGAPLDTLVGSFGFNEKFQCAQELFNGSSEDFNEAVAVLDQQSSFAEAKKQLLYYIHLNKWDLEENVTIEFIRKVERRYH